MNVVSIAPSDLDSGPSVVGDASSFPSGATTIPLQLTPCQKPAPVATGVMRMTVASPSAFVALAGFGTTVTKGDTLYFRSNAPVQIRKTYTPASGGPFTAVNYVSGLVIEEVDPANPLTLFEVQGTANIEWYVSGQI